MLPDICVKLTNSGLSLCLTCPTTLIAQCAPASAQTWDQLLKCIFKSTERVRNAKDILFNYSLLQEHYV